MRVFVGSADRPVQAPRGEVPPKRSRIATSALRPSVPSSQPSSNSPLRWSKTAEALETAALAAAVTGHVLTLMHTQPAAGDSSRLAAHTAVGRREAKGDKGYPSVNAAWLTAPLLVAAITRNVSHHLQT